MRLFLAPWLVLAVPAVAQQVTVTQALAATTSVSMTSCDAAAALAEVQAQAQVSPGIVQTATSAMTDAVNGGQATANVSTQVNVVDDPAQLLLGLQQSADASAAGEVGNTAQASAAQSLQLASAMGMFQLDIASTGAASTAGCDMAVTSSSTSVKLVLEATDACQLSIGFGELAQLAAMDGAFGVVETNVAMSVQTPDGELNRKEAFFSVTPFSSTESATIVVALGVGENTINLAAVSDALATSKGIAAAASVSKGDEGSGTGTASVSSSSTVSLQACAVEANDGGDDDDSSSADDDSKSGDDDSKSADDDSKSGDDDSKSGDDDSKSGGDDSKSGDADSKSGDADSKSGDDDSKSGDDGGDGGAAAA